MLEAGGMAGTSGKLSSGDIDPKCLGHLLKAGTGKPGETDNHRMAAMARLVAGLKATDCKKLNNMLGEGGLGQAPEVMGRLVGQGCDGDVKTVRTLMSGFDSKANRLGLASVLHKGGLNAKPDAKTGTSKVGPDCLKQIFADVSGDKPNNVNDANFAKTRAAAFGKLCKDLGDDTICGNLKTTLEFGGLGAEPKVLGQLVGKGCVSSTGQKGDGSKLGSLVAELASSGTNAKLASMLQAGGFGTKAADGKAVAFDVAAPKAECLAMLVEPGCNGDPKELSKLLGGLGDAQMGQMKGMMDSGKLGQNPEVLADLYQNGCLQNPNGDATGSGAKNPQVLVDILGQFSSKPDAQLFGRMMDNAKMDKWDKNKEVSRLGSLVRHGLTPKAGGAQDATKLKQLFTGFDGHEAKLNTMCNRFEAAPDWMLEQNKNKSPNQPGKSVQNLLNSPKQRGFNNAGKLRDEFYDKMEAYAPLSAGGKQKLMQTAALFEHMPSPGAVDTTCGGHDFPHVLERHTRKYNKVKNSWTANHNNLATSLYPRDVKEEEVKAKIKAAGKAVHDDAGKVLPVNTGQLGAGGKLGHTVGAPAERSRIGFSNGGGQVKIGQFYPVTTLNMQKVECADVNKLDEILN